MTPCRRSECTIEAKFFVNAVALSHRPENSAVVPRLMLITFTPYAGWSRMNWRPEMTCWVSAKDPSAASTLTITSFDDGATPTGARAVAGHDPGHIGAVAVVVPPGARGGLRVLSVGARARGEDVTPLPDQRVLEIGMVQLHPGVEDRDRHALARIARRARLVGVDQRIDLQVIRVTGHVEIDALYLRVAGQPRQAFRRDSPGHAKDGAPTRGHPEASARPRQDAGADEAHGRVDAGKRPRLLRLEGDLNERRPMRRHRVLDARSYDARVRVQRSEEQGQRTRGLDADHVTSP